MRILYGIFFLGLVFFTSPLHGAQQKKDESQPLCFPASLLNHPNESAEEILLRAHQYDARAIALTVIGYSEGIGGFPRDSGIAWSWLNPLMNTGSVESAALAVFFVNRSMDALEARLGESLASCEAARQSSFAQLLKEADMFDMDAICLPLERAKETSPQWEKDYIDTQDFYNRLRENTKSVVELARALPVRDLTQEETTILDRSVGEGSLSYLVFYMATTHDIGKETPNWDNSRLLAILDRQEAIRTGKAQGELLSPAITLVIKEGLLSSTLYQTEPKETQLALLSAAHDGDLTAMRTLAKYYRLGIEGFPEDKILGRAWYLSNVLQGDATSALILAADHYANADFGKALAYTDVYLQTTQEKAPHPQKLAHEIKNRIEASGNAKVLMRAKQIRNDIKSLSITSN